jgi:hypothetical protein
MSGIRLLGTMPFQDQLLSRDTSTSPVPFNLQVGSTGSQVTTVHTALLRLGYHLEPIEVVNAVFGINTRKRTVEFQTAHFVTPTGIVDEGTALLLFEEAACAEPRRYVFGLILQPNGTLGVDLTVKVFSRILRRETLLAETSSDDAGYYHAHYLPNQSAQGGEGSTDLLVRVIRGDEVLYDPTTSQVVYNAPDLNVININLVKGDTNVLDEYTSIVDTINSILKDQDVGLADLQQDDITFLANNAGLDPIKITQIVVAAKIQSAYKIPGDFSYAVFVEGGLSTSSQTSITGLRVQVGLSTDTQTLLYDMVLTPFATLTTAVQTAINNNIVPASLSNQLPSVEKILTQYTDEANTYVKNHPPDTLLLSQIQENLSNGVGDALQSFFQNGAYGDISYVLSSISAALKPASNPTNSATSVAPVESRPTSTAAPPAATASTAAATSPQAPDPTIASSSPSTTSVPAPSFTNDPNIGLTPAPKPPPAPNLPPEIASPSSLITKIAQLKKIEPEKELSKFSEDDWVDAMKHSELETSSASAEWRENQAKILLKTMETKFPTSSFAAQLRRNNEAFGEHTAAIAGILEDHPDFDLAKGNVKLLFPNKSPLQAAPAGNEDKTHATLEKMKAIQRIFKLAPTFRQTKALFGQGITSSAAIKALGRSRFVTEFGSTPSHPFTTSQAKEVFHKAESIHLATTLLVGELHSLSSSLSIKGLSAPLPPGHLAAVTDEFPNLSTLFQLGNPCSCDDCMTVYSASAYLVDTLWFLAKRSYLDTTVPPPAPPAQGVDARKVLFERRGDLGDLDLSCDNTNTTLPYIDLVCELLEDEIANFNGYKGFTLPSSVTLNTGLISNSPNLLTTLTGLVSPLTGLNYPFTSNATVSDPDKSTGSRVVRDTLVVVKLTPTPPGSTTWIGKELRQTYQTSAQLAAAPYYVNCYAYATLANAYYAFSLPFDLPHQETVAYFAQFGISRPSLMRALSSPSTGPFPIDIACEELSITTPERTLITVADPSDQSKYWNITTGITDPMIGLGNVSVLLTKSGLAYSDLQTIMGLGLNSVVSWLNPNNNLYIIHTDSTCNLTAKQIANIQVADIDRLHRFLRLYNKVQGSGWDIASLDEAIVAAKLGNLHLDQNLLQKLAELQRLLSKVPSISVSEVVSLYDVLQLNGAVYAAVFLNVPANGPVDTNFLPANVTQNEQTEKNHPGTGNTVNYETIPATFALCLGRTAADITLLLGSLPNGVATPFTTASISTVYLRHLFALRANISISNLMILRTLTGLDELSEPTATLSLLESLATVQSSGLTLVDLQFFLLNQGSELNTGTLTDQVITVLLTGLQPEYQTAQTNDASSYNATATSTENIPALLASANKLPGFTASDSNNVQSIIQNTWANPPPSTPASFIDLVFGPFMDTTAIKAAQNKLATLPSTATSADIENAKLALISAFASGVSSYLYNQDKQTLILALVQQQFGVSQAMATLVLSIIVPTIQSTRTLMAILTDDLLIDPLPSAPLVIPPVIDPTDFILQFKVLRFLQIMLAFVTKMGLAITDVTWMLTNCSTLQWMSPADVMYEADVPPVPFSNWVKLWHGVQLNQKFPPVTNPTNQSVPFSIYGFFQLVVTSGSTVADALEYLSNVTGWDDGMLTDLNTQFNINTTLPDYANPSVVHRLDTATALLRTLNMTVTLAVNVIKATLLTSDAAIMRNALKALYGDSSWLGVLQNIMNPLRLMKRDALVNYLLLCNDTNLPTISSVDDLYDYFLIDCEMGTELLTSRIVQGHGTIQLFAQRCLMGLELTCTADQTLDADWLQWNLWMSQFQVWVANRKVFLWPENYIVPNLRDNKSEIFEDFENTLQQNQPSSTTAESATIAYLEALNGIAQLEVACTYFEDATGIMHVFARTKGGDPLVYYYRQFQQEQTWTPWTEVTVKINDEHLVAFTRNGRLSIAWLQMQLETEQNQGQQYPPSTTLPAQQRWNIQLAVSECDLAGNWGAPSLSKTPLYVPSSGYADGTSLPPTTDFHIFSWDLGDAVGQAISVTLTWNTANPGFDSTVGGSALYVGSFSLGGCAGYPQPNPASSYHQYLSIIPRFYNCLMLPQAYIKALPATNTVAAASVYAKSNFFPTDFTEILETTYGIFRTVIPTQISPFDWGLTFLMLSIAAGETVIPTPATQATRFSIIIPNIISALYMGTYMPFFHNDPSRTWIVLPEISSNRSDDDRVGNVKSAPTIPAKETYIIITAIIQLALNLINRYLPLWNKYHDFSKIQTALLSDPDWTAFLEIIIILRYLSESYLFKNFYHPLICYLRTQADSGGVTLLMDRSTQLYDTDFDFQTTYKPTSAVDTAYPKENLDFSSDGSYSSYNWELFFHIPFEVGYLLNQQQQYADAQTWYNYVFNPLGASEGGKSPNKYWNMKYFYKTSVADYTAELIYNILHKLAGDPQAPGNLASLQQAVSDWRADPFNPHAIARSRPVAYQVALVLNYIQNLIDWGDSLFTEFTMESVVLATQLYILADKLLGPEPQTVPPAVPTPPNTFNELEGKLDIFGNALLDLENLVPDLSVLPHGKLELDSPPPSSPTAMSFPTLYFALPQNENLPQYWSTVADRLFKIRNGMNIDGVPASLALFSPPIDPGALVRALAGGVSPTAAVQAMATPLPAYRFTFMSQKAIELAALTAGFGEALLSTLEKRDAEALARLRSNQELLVLNAVQTVKTLAITEGQNAVTALQTSRLVAEERYNFYSTQSYMNVAETIGTTLAGVSLGLELGVTLAYALAGALKTATPSMTFGAAGFGGSPVATMCYGPENFGGGPETIATSLASARSIIDKGAAMAYQQGIFMRRQDEWNFNATLATREMATIDAQTATAQAHVAMLQADLQAHNVSIQYEQAVNNFLTSKFTNTELYDWMVTQLGGLYKTAYNMAFDLAKRSEAGMLFELADTSNSAPFITYTYGTSLQTGLIAAKTLQSSIQAMQSSYIQRNTREYELTKNISLLELDPFALLSLRSTGSCTVSIPEDVFDLDHPGQYLRRNKSIAISIPCVAGPQVAVSAKLSLLSNRYRALAIPNPSPAPVNPPQNPDYYPEYPPGADTRFVYNVGAIQSVALSTAINDAGIFDLSFTSDDRYLPFERTGAIAVYSLELPTVIKRFDYDTITDVIFHIHYTARDGGDNFRHQLVELNQQARLNQLAADQTQPAGLYQAFDLRRQFSSQWMQLVKLGSTSLVLGDWNFPYFVRGQKMSAQLFMVLARVNGNPATFAVNVGGTALTLGKGSGAFGNLLYNTLTTGAVPIVLGTGIELTVDPKIVTNLVDLWLVALYELGTG